MENSIYSCLFVGSGYALNTRLSFSHLFNLVSRLSKTKSETYEICTDDDERKSIRFYFDKNPYVATKYWDEDGGYFYCNLTLEGDPNELVDYKKCHTIYRSLYHTS